MGAVLLAPFYKWVLHDFVRIARGRIGIYYFHRYPPGELAWLLISRSVLVCATFVVPLVVLSAPWWHIVAGFAAMHLITGVMLTALVQPPHVSAGTTFRVAADDGTLGVAYADHVTDVVCDFCVDSRIIFLLSAGLNLHVAHHLFPAVSHIHLPELTPIVRRTSRITACDTSPTTACGARSRPTTCH